jgi:cytochrome c oxidase subunit 1
VAGFAAYLMMGLTGIFGVIAVIGGGLWIGLVVWSLLFGKKLDGGPVSDKPTPIPDQSVAAPPPAPAATTMSACRARWCWPSRLLVCFVLYYFVNWKYLSEVWGLS